MSERTFSVANEAMELLDSAIQEARSIDARKRDIGKLARTCLQGKGAYVYGIGGEFGGADGLYGGPSQPGVRAIQGTEPVNVEPDKFIALRHGHTAKDANIYLVQTKNNDGLYLRHRSKFVLAIIDAKDVTLPYIPSITEEQLTAVGSLVETISTALPPVFEPWQKALDLPREMIFGGMEMEGQIINLREVGYANLPTGLRY